MNPNIPEEIRLNDIEENPVDEYIASLPLPVEPLPKVIDPDNPPWGAGMGLLVWIASVIFLFLFQSLFLVPHLLSTAKDGKTVSPDLFMSPTAVLLMVISIIPAHLATIAIVWFVATGGNKRSFIETLGLRADKSFIVLLSPFLAICLLAIGAVVTKYIGGSETDIDKIINASMPARFLMAFVAAFTAPLTEELVYRGVLYAGLRKSLERVIPGDSRKSATMISVVIVSLLFGLVHVLQYINNIGVIMVIMYLSVALTIIRAYSGKLLPCVIIHFVFNGIQAVIIVAEPYLPKPAVPEPTIKQGVILFENFIRLFF